MGQPNIPTTGAGPQKGLLALLSITAMPQRPPRLLGRVGAGQLGPGRPQTGDKGRVRVQGRPGSASPGCPPLSSAGALEGREHTAVQAAVGAQGHPHGARPRADRTRPHPHILSPTSDGCWSVGRAAFKRKALRPREGSQCKRPVQPESPPLSGPRRAGSKCCGSGCWLNGLSTRAGVGGLPRKAPSPRQQPSRRLFPGTSSPAGGAWRPAVSAQESEQPGSAWPRREPRLRPSPQLRAASPSGPSQCAQQTEALWESSFLPASLWASGGHGLALALLQTEGDLGLSKGRYPG